MAYFFLFIIIVLILFSDVSLLLTNEKDKTNIRIRFLYIFLITLNNDYLKKNIEKIKNKGLNEGFNDFKRTIKYNKVLFSFLKRTKIDYLSLTYYESFENINLNKCFMFSGVLKIFDTFIKNTFLNVGKTYYFVRVGLKEDIDLKVKVKISTFDLIWVGIKNIKSIHNMKKRKKEQI